MPCRLVFSGADNDLNKVKKHLEDCNTKVVARLSTCIHNIEENMNSVDVENHLSLLITLQALFVCQPMSQ